MTYTFRTTFDLAGAAPETAVLRGQFLADNHVTAIRLNGRNVDVPKQHQGVPFAYWAEFKVADGFVAGTNVLEIDVLNKDPRRPPDNSPHFSPMALRVELHGSALARPLHPPDAQNLPKKEKLP